MHGIARQRAGDRFAVDRLWREAALAGDGFQLGHRPGGQEQLSNVPIRIFERRFDGVLPPEPGAVGCDGAGTMMFGGCVPALALAHVRHI